VRAGSRSISGARYSHASRGRGCREVAHTAAGNLWTATFFLDASSQRMAFHRRQLCDGASLLDGGQDHRITGDITEPARQAGRLASGSEHRSDPVSNLSNVGARWMGMNGTLFLPRVKRCRLSQLAGLHPDASGCWTAHMVRGSAITRYSLDTRAFVQTLPTPMSYCDLRHRSVMDARCRNSRRATGATARHSILTRRWACVLDRLKSKVRTSLVFKLDGQAYATVSSLSLLFRERR